MNYYMIIIRKVMTWLICMAIHKGNEGGHITKIFSLIYHKTQILTRSNIICVSSLLSRNSICISSLFLYRWPAKFSSRANLNSRASTQSSQWVFTHLCKKLQGDLITMRKIFQMGLLGEVYSLTLSPNDLQSSRFGLILRVTHSPL